LSSTGVDEGLLSTGVEDGLSSDMDMDIDIDVLSIRVLPPLLPLANILS